MIIDPFVLLLQALSEGEEYYERLQGAEANWHNAEAQVLELKTQVRRRHQPNDVPFHVTRSNCYTEQRAQCYFLNVGNSPTLRVFYVQHASSTDNW